MCNEGEFRRPTTGGGSRPSSAVRAITGLNRNSGSSGDQIFEVRVGEPWSATAKNLLRSKLGLAQEVHGSTYDRIRRAKVLVFTGHHWVRHGERPGSFHPMNNHGRPIKNRGIDLTSAHP
jgi:hypothetical protein